LADIRVNKISTSDSFEKYWEQIKYLNYLNIIYEEIDMYLPDLEKEYQRHRKRIYINAIPATIGAIIGGLIIWLITHC
jgi:hypothetical protein